MFVNTNQSSLGWLIVMDTVSRDVTHVKQLSKVGGGKIALHFISI